MGTPMDWPHSGQFSGGNSDFLETRLNPDKDFGSEIRSRYNLTRLPEPSFMYRTTWAPHSAQ